MGELNVRGRIDVATLALYIPILIATTAALIRRGIFTGTGFLYLLVFIILKIVGAAMAIDIQRTGNTSLATPAAVLSTVVLSPLLMATLSILTLDDRPNAPKIHNDRAAHLSRLTHILIIVSLALGIVGGIHVFSTTARCTAETHCNDLTFLRAAAGLSIAAWALIGVAVVIHYANRRRERSMAMDTRKEQRARRVYPLVLALTALVLLLLLARLVFTVGVAVTIGTDRTQVFNPITGSWVLYLCLAWIPEMLASSSLAAIGLLK